MPPKFDPKTEVRILKAAARIVHGRGEPGLTLRRVAREARTTTPTVYRRFRNKQAIHVALAAVFRMQLAEECLAATTLEEFCRRWVGFAERHPNEYKLLWGSLAELIRPREVPRPIRAWLLSQLAQRFGGTPDDYVSMYFALLLLCHGAATILTNPGGSTFRKQVRDNFLLSADAILHNAQAFRREQKGPCP